MPLARSEAVALSGLGGIRSFAFGRSAGAGGIWGLVLALLLLAAFQAVEGLDHPTRRRIYDHLLRVPGDHLRSIPRALRLAAGTVRYHLDVLVHKRLVQIRREDGRSRFYPMGHAAESSVNRLYERHWAYRSVRSRVLLAIGDEDEVRPTAVARRLGISRQLASYHLSRLAASGMLVRDGARYRR